MKIMLNDALFDIAKYIYIMYNMYKYTFYKKGVRFYESCGNTQSNKRWQSVPH